MLTVSVKADPCHIFQRISVVHSTLLTPSTTNKPCLSAWHIPTSTGPCLVHARHNRGREGLIIKWNEREYITATEVLYDSEMTYSVSQPQQYGVILQCLHQGARSTGFSPNLPVSCSETEAKPPFLPGMTPSLS